MSKKDKFITIRRSDFRDQGLEEILAKRPEISYADVFDFGLAALKQANAYFNQPTELTARLLYFEDKRKAKKRVSKSRKTNTTNSVL